MRHIWLNLDQLQNDCWIIVKTNIYYNHNDSTQTIIKKNFNGGETKLRENKQQNDNVQDIWRKINVGENDERPIQEIQPKIND